MAKTRPGLSKKARSRRAHLANQPRSEAERSKPRPPPNKPPEVLMNDAMTCMTQGDLQGALLSAQKALKAVDGSSGTSGNMQGIRNNVVNGVGLAAVCALLGEIHLDAGEADEARKFLERSAALDPDGQLPDALGGGVDKYLYLAQLSENGGRDSVSWFEKGASALRLRLQEAGSDSGEDSDEEAEQMKEKLAQILCAVVEVWMTDLSFEPDCEAQCESLTTEATMVAPENPEVWQTLASVRISQSRPADAKAAIQRSLQLWEDLPPDHPAVPIFSVRVGLVRLLLTIGWFEKAIDLTTLGLLREDDQAVEVWYLAAYANYLQGQELRELQKSTDKKEQQWKGFWKEARRCFARCLKLFQQQAYEDDRLGAHAEELLEEVVKAVGPVLEKEAEGEDDGSGWEDEEDEEDEEGDEDGEDEDEDEDDDDDDDQIGNDDPMS